MSGERIFYTHYPPGVEIRAAAGYYVLEEEKKLRFQERQVLFARGYVSVESSCCGTGGCAFVVVPGYLLGWHISRNDKGEPMSEIELIHDESARQAIRKILMESEKVQQVNFW